MATVCKVTAGLLLCAAVFAFALSGVVDHHGTSLSLITHPDVTTSAARITELEGQSSLTASCRVSCSFAGQLREALEAQLAASQQEKALAVDAAAIAPKGGGGFIHRNITYGHIHMAKTGGTTINLMMAGRFERVCGHKGYSYDRYQANALATRHHATSPRAFPSAGFPKGFSRARYPFGMMEEIGWEDCDYISNEVKASWWIKTFAKWHTPVELHLPCRDPIDHLLSSVNSIQSSFNCSASSLWDEIQRITFYWGDSTRWDNKLLEVPNFHVKCVEFKSQFTGYMERMSTMLQTRLKVVEKFYQLETNQPRNKEKECLLTDLRVQQIVRKLMVERLPYHQFCNKCLNSSDNVMHNA